MEPPQAPRSAYLHIPFCHRRCFYCDFPVVPLGDRADGGSGPGARSISAYLELLHAEIGSAPSGPPLSTVYFGGGTPSLLTPEQVGELLRALRRHFGMAEGVEITLEVDPASFDEPRLTDYRGRGVNRFSLGGQSFDDDVLRSLGRRHRAVDLVEAAEWLEAAHRRGDLRSWSLDLIQGLPGQSLNHWDEQLSRALALAPPHLSVYDLIVEPGTVFARRQERQELHLPDEELAADLMEHTARRLRRAGYGHYEISNYALPGHASRHNRVYWSGAGWWGFGMGATAAPWGERQARPRTRAAYTAWLAEPGRSRMESVGGGGMPVEELVLVGLRRREGVAMERLLGRAGVRGEEARDLRRRLENYERGGLLLIEGPRWRLSDPAGLALSNAVLREFLSWWDDRGDQADAGRRSSHAGLQSPDHGRSAAAG